MASCEKDKVPMLSDTYPKPSDEFLDSKFQRLVTRTRSASMSIPMSSMEPYERETNLVGHTGPLRSERKTPFVQMSGPLYVTRGSDNPFQQNKGIAADKSAENKVESFPSFKGTVEDDWHDNYAGKNEHLLRSGQLGMCNDPYCTTCPTYFKPIQQRTPKASGIFDPKVSFFLKQTTRALYFQ